MSREFATLALLLLGKAKHYDKTAALNKNEGRETGAAEFSAMAEAYRDAANLLVNPHRSTVEQDMFKEEIDDVVTSVISDISDSIVGWGYETEFSALVTLDKFKEALE